MRWKAWAVRLGVVAGCAVFAVYLGLWAALVTSGASDEADFSAFYTGWTIVAQGRGADLYDPAVQTEVQRQVLGGRQFEAGLNPFNNPPHLVLPFLPLTVLSLDQGYLVWAAVQVALLAWLLWRLLTRIADRWTRSEQALLVAATLAAPPLLFTLLQGSLSLVVTVATLELYLALRARRDRIAGIWLVVGSLKPQVALAPAVALLAARRWSTLLVAALVALALAAAASAVMGPGIWLSYLRFLVRLPRLVRPPERPPLGHVEPARNADPAGRARPARGSVARSMGSRSSASSSGSRSLPGCGAADGIPTIRASVRASP